MAGLCQGGNEPSGSLKAISTGVVQWCLPIRSYARARVRFPLGLIIWLVNSEVFPNRKANFRYILDLTIRFETHADQPHEVDSEKKRIYEPTIPFYKDEYSLSHIDVIGLMRDHFNDDNNHCTDHRFHRNSDHKQVDDNAEHDGIDDDEHDDPIS
ncbi:hypothetical protein ANN_17065 [Periplaneta americana]|uniref:Uncharacterized protein n=1 Tax=Periplaneta americana TaxID=6978 RepID=A0ABQ8SRV6_PERAM|nr:hypothetical protein ANN_17065 [Periplaneta americana]